MNVQKEPAVDKVTYISATALLLSLSLFENEMHLRDDERCGNVRVAENCEDATSVRMADS